MLVVDPAGGPHFFSWFRYFYFLSYPPPFKKPVGGDLFSTSGPTFDLFFFSLLQNSTRFRIYFNSSELEEGNKTKGICSSFFFTFILWNVAFCFVFFFGRAYGWGYNFFFWVTFFCFSTRPPVHTHTWIFFFWKLTWRSLKSIRYKEEIIIQKRKEVLVYSRMLWAYEISILPSPSLCLFIHVISV